MLIGAYDKAFAHPSSDQRKVLLQSASLLTKGAARVRTCLCQIVALRSGVRRFDVAAMFGSLWLLASMVIDAATPKELSVYMIGAAIAPATAISAILYWLRIPRTDFAVIFATLWMISAMVLELITPKPLSPLMVLIAFVPLVIVGIVLNFQYWRRSRLQSISIQQPLASSD